MGSDAYHGLSTWHRYKELFDLCNFIVVNRPNEEEWIGAKINDFFTKKLVKRIDTRANGQIFILQLPMIAVSSTEIRRCIQKQERVTEFLPESVADYIDARELYS